MSQREVFGRLIGANQALSHPLADAYARLKAAWHMVMVAGWRYDTGLPCGEEANTAKYLAAEAGYLAADRAMQTHGGVGYASEYHVERYSREPGLMRIAPVSQEMTLNFLAQNVLGLPGATDHVHPRRRASGRPRCDRARGRRRWPARTRGNDGDRKRTGDRPPVGGRGRSGRRRRP